MCWMILGRAMSNAFSACGPIFSLEIAKLDGRGDRIRTCDLYVPNVALYQAKLRPDIFTSATLAAESLKEQQRQGWRKQKIGTIASMSTGALFIWFARR